MQKSKGNEFTIRHRFKSFGHAFAGLFDMLIHQHNARIHAAATIFALGLSWWLQVDRIAFALIAMTVGMVWVAEVLNTVLELVVDLASSGQYSNLAKRAKDMAASAVLIAAAGAVLIGLVVLGPPLYERFF